MPSNRENLTAQELIGLKIVVKTSPDPNIRGLAGIVRDETRNTLKVEARGRILTIPKRDAFFLVELGSGQSTVLNGNQLAFRPEDRIKKGLGRWQ